MVEQIKNILRQDIEILSESPLQFTCCRFGNTYNTASALANSDLQFGTLVLNERKSVLITPGTERQTLTIHKGRSAEGIIFFS